MKAGNLQIVYDSVFHCVPHNLYGDQSNSRMMNIITTSNQIDSVQVFQRPFSHSVPANNAKVSQKRLTAAILDRNTVF